jgi:hypothetical protein
VTIQNKTTLIELEHYPSLAEFWSDYYREYLDVNAPRLMIRFEDMLFHGKAVMQAVAKCAGYDPLDAYTYVTEPAKLYQNQTSSFLTAVQQYTVDYARLAGFRASDIFYLQDTINSTLLQMLHYPGVSKYVELLQNL